MTLLFIYGEDRTVSPASPALIEPEAVRLAGASYF